MSHSKLRSIAAKLFYLTTSLVILTVAGNSYQNALMFNRHVEREVQENTIQMAKERAAAIEGLFGHWRSELALLVHSLGLRATNDEKLAELAAYLDANRDVVELEIIQQIGKDRVQVQVALGTKDVTAPAFEGRKVADISRELRDYLPNSIIATAPKTGLPQVRMVNLAPLTKLPLVAIFYPFGITGKGEVNEQNNQYWAVMVRWAGPMVAALPSATASRRSTVISKSGKVLISPNLGETISAVPLAGPSLVSDALASGGFGLKIFKDSGGAEWLGAYAQINALNATIVVEKSASEQQLAASSIVRRSAIWGWAFVLLAVLVSFFGAASITANLRSLTRTTQEIAAGNLEAKVVTRGGDEVSLLGNSVQHMASKILILLKEQVAKAQFEKELETAEIVQNSLFPKSLAESKDLRIGSYYQPASKCGGDWWGRFQCADGSEIVCMGDATGHGVGAALVTALVYACCTTAAAIQRENQPDEAFSPAALLTRINQVMWESVSGKIAMTFVAVHLDLRRGVLTYANGGHNFPLLWPATRDDDRYQTLKMRKSAAINHDPLTLVNGGTPLGMGAEGGYKDHTISLRAGDKLVLYTDGLLECQNPAGEQWGKRRFLGSLRGLVGGDPAVAVATMSADALAFYAGEPLADDITLVVVEVPRLVTASEAAA